MTRKHFEAIAAIFREYYYPDPMGEFEKGAQGRTLNLISEFADYLQDQNPNFDRTRFVNACKGQ